MKRRPEDQLLLVCSRTNVSSDQKEEIKRIVAGPLDWAIVLEQARRHCVVPLVQRSLHFATSHNVPHEVQDLLQKAVRQIAFHNLQRTRELIRVLHLFEAHNIQALPFKGPVLAAHIYGNLTLRQFADLDIMIKKRDLVHARSLLLQEGYTPDKALANVEDLSAFAAKNHDYRMWRGESVMLELAWQLQTRPFAFPPLNDDWWQTLGLKPFGGYQIRTLTTEQLLLLLCVHGSKHMWERLIWVCDVAEILRTQQIDWSLLCSEARRLNVERMLRLGLSVAHELLDAPLPEDILQATTADTTISKLRSHALELLFREGELSSHTTMKIALYRFWMIDRFRDRLAAAIDHAPSLLEPVRVWKTYGLAPLKHLFGLS